MASTGSNFGVQEDNVAPVEADIIVALTSYNDVATIGAVARALRDGLAHHFPSKAVRFVLADAGSADGTREAAREVLGPETLLELEYERGAELGELPYHGYPGRVAALWAILHAARRTAAKACVVIDAGLEKMELAWIERLIAPVLVGEFDYVSPYYLRHANEGTITKGIVYPVFRAMYGVRLRQPAAMEFACSGRLVTYLLKQNFWDFDQASAGIDLWMAVAAATGGFRMCEAALGVRGASSRGTSGDLSTTLSQVMGALFADMEYRVDVWQRVRGSTAIPVFGSVLALDPEVSPLNIGGLVESFRLGYRELREIWTWVLPPRTILELRKLADAQPEGFRFDDRLWASIIYDFAVGYSLRVMPRDHLLRSLTPLYSGWLSSFVLEMTGASLARIEGRVEQVCLSFESEKRHLISRWRWPERFR